MTNGTGDTVTHLAPVKVHLRVSDIEALKQAAEAHNRPLSGEIRHAISLYLAGLRRQNQLHR